MEQSMRDESDFCSDGSDDSDDSSSSCSDPDHSCSDPDNLNSDPHSNLQQFPIDKSQRKLRPSLGFSNSPGLHFSVLFSMSN